MEDQHHFFEIINTILEEKRRELPVIIVARDDRLWLYSQSINGPIHETVAYIPSQYTYLKTVDHHISAALMAAAKGLHHKLKELKDEFEVSVSKAQLWSDTNRFKARHLRLYHLAITLCNHKISKTECPYQVLEELRDLMWKNVSDAAECHLDALHDQIQKWKKMFTANEWNKIAVVVMGPPLPRIGSLLSQYFARLTGKDYKGVGIFPDFIVPHEERERKRNRILFYAENVKDPEQGIELMLEDLIAGPIAQASLGDSMALKIDLLAKSAFEKLHASCSENNNQ